ncbi:MAG: N-acetylmuramoyl-L-alanine amidase [Oscillospiraceae bacterium]|nr:N-acetylmuramoyl-L-alanine amidase [Candidatus Ruminococcus equi]
MKIKHLYILICSLLFLSFVILMITAFKNISFQVMEDRIADFPTVIIDAGHGGEDGGCVAKDGTLEKDINLSISKKLSEMLREKGFNVREIRTEDISIYNDNSETLSEKKTSDLHNRLAIFNSNENNVIISIHQNHFSDSSYYGTQVFYSKNNSNSKILAEAVRKSVKESLQKDNERETKQADKSIFLLDNATVPAVIVECGFLSNDNEREKLKTEEYQNKMAYAICLGFLEYYYTK